MSGHLIFYGAKYGTETALESDLVPAMAPADLLRGQSAFSLMPALWELFPVALEIQTGTPPEPGRYVVYTPCAARQIREWCEPHIAVWYDGRWIFGDPVVGWIGPLPLVNQRTIVATDEADFARQYENRDYDL